MKKQMGIEVSFEEASKMTQQEIDSVFKEAKEKGMKSYSDTKKEMEIVAEKAGLGTYEPAQKLQVVEQGIVMPAVSATEAVKAWNAYLDLKKKIATPEDTQTIQGREFFKKSYWRKLATFFNLSVDFCSFFSFDAYLNICFVVFLGKVDVFSLFIGMDEGRGKV